jgi:2-keto-4-pentenoate hydratase/2-oxohepta-3-ene-1,7-dioic acid hydratase in catechol pathway
VRSAADAAGVAGLDFAALEVTCAVNGEVRQRGRAADMAFPIPFLISYISGIMTLEPGDIIATGTPEGVGPLEAGDEVVVEVSAGGEVLSAVRNGVEDPAAEG